MPRRKDRKRLLFALKHWLGIVTSPRMAACICKAKPDVSTRRKRVTLKRRHCCCRNTKRAFFLPVFLPLKHCILQFESFWLSFLSSAQPTNQGEESIVVVVVVGPFFGFPYSVFWGVKRQKLSLKRGMKRQKLYLKRDMKRQKPLSQKGGEIMVH